MLETVAASAVVDESAKDQRFRQLIADFMTRNADLPNYQQKVHLLLADSPCSDVGNALRLFARFGTNIRYISRWESWFIWNGRIWKQDESNLILTYAQETAGYIVEEARAIRPEALSTEEEKDLADRDKAARGRAEKLADKLDKWALSSQSSRSVDSMIKQLQGVRGVTISPDSLDTADSLLNCMNGSLDLITCELSKPQRSNLITKITGADFDATAQAPAWEQFVLKVSSGDKDVARYIQQLTGLGLCGMRYASILPIHYGSGGNGKSVYVEVVKAVVGDYAATANTDLFIERQSGGPTNDIARLVGVRFLTASETREGAPLNEALVKQLTGGDKMTARFLHKEFFDFLPKFTPMLLTNHKPTIKNTDNGIWRRIRLVSWRHDFTTDPDARPFEEVMGMFRQEYAGILAWAVRGFIDVRTNGLILPDRVKADTEQYKAESDLIGDFVDECLTRETGARETKAAVYTKYQEHMKATGHNALADNKLTTKLRERNIEEKRGGGGVRYWLNVRLKTDADFFAEELNEPTVTQDPLQPEWEAF